MGREELSEHWVWITSIPLHVFWFSPLLTVMFVPTAWVPQVSHHGMISEVQMGGDEPPEMLVLVTNLCDDVTRSLSPDHAFSCQSC